MWVCVAGPGHDLVCDTYITDCKKAPLRDGHEQSKSKAVARVRRGSMNCERNYINKKNTDKKEV